MEINGKTDWQAVYDVIIIGFGGAGATAARFAADKGADVLLVDSAPEGHEGGNTRYSAQLIATGDNFEQTKKYYQNLTAPLSLDEKMLDTFVNGLVNIPNYVSKYLNVKPLSMKDYSPKTTAAYMEYPEFEGAKSQDITTVSKTWSNAALWKLLRKLVVNRKNHIDVLFKTPARELIQNSKTKEIEGVIIERNKKLIRVKAKNGVVLACGGFENNQRMIEDYLGATNLAPLGTLYNKGDGIRMVQDIGADFWHMNNFESFGLLHGMDFVIPQGERGRLMLGVQKKVVSTGSLFLVGDDGTRYFNEAEANRHGHIKNHGQWKVPLNQEHPYLIFDETKKKELDSDKIISKYKPYTDNIVEADSIKELAEKICINPNNLAKSLSLYNQAAKSKNDEEFHRDPSTMSALTGEKIFAVRMEQTVLNTQGGPRRNEKAEVLDTKGNPIPHLYSAGELGGINANQYQAGGNLAECLIWGKIAGENAAEVKHDSISVDEVSGGSEKISHLTSDLIQETYSTNANQFIGRSGQGMGNEIVVRVTVDDMNLKNIEVLKQSESDDYGLKAIKSLPQEMVRNNSIDVDAVSGATASSRGLKEAVKNALSKVTKNNS